MTTIRYSCAQCRLTRTLRVPRRTAGTSRDLWLNDVLARCQADHGNLSPDCRHWTFNIKAKDSTDDAR